MRKLTVLMVIMALLGSLLCACQSVEKTAAELENEVPDAEYLYEQVKVLGVSLESAGIFCHVMDNESKDPVNLLFVRSNEYNYLPPESYGFDYAGIYMLDMDTGKWYDSSFLNRMKMTSFGGTPDLNKREDIIMESFGKYGGLVQWNYEWDAVQMISTETIDAVNQRMMLDTLTKTVADYPYASVDEEPRLLSDEELAELKYSPAGCARAAISTVSDAIAYMDYRYPSLWMGMSVHNGKDTKTRWLRSAAEILHYSGDAMASRACVVNCLTYLLSDDYQIESLIGFWQDSENISGTRPEKAINAIKTETGYLFFDPVLRMRGDVISRQGDLLPEMNCGSVAEYVEYIRVNPQLSSVVKFIFKNSGGVRMDYQLETVPEFKITTNSPDIEMVYISKDVQEAGAHIKPENIGNYKISGMLGGTTLTPEEAYELVGAAPEVVQAKVKTAADVLMYMMAARMVEGTGCYCTEIGNQVWHWNMDAATFMQDRRAGCGQCANLGRYLLDGDYEEIGFVDHTYNPGGGGGHVYNYILHEDKYYIVDFSWYYFAGYATTNDNPIPVLDTLEEWGEKVHHYYGDVCLSMTYSTKRGLPVVYGEEDIFYIPDSAEYTVLYDSGSGFRFGVLPFDKQYYDWNSFF